MLGKAVPFVLLLLVAAGVLALYPELAGIWALAIGFPLLLIMLLRVLPPEWVVGIGVVIGALVIPVFALLGADWVIAKLEPWSPDPLVSLLLGALITGLAAWIYLRPWWVREISAHPWRWTIAIVAVLIVLPPVAFAIAGLIKGDGRALAQPVPAVSRLDVIVLREGDGPLEDDATRTQGWQVQRWVGQVAGEQIDWGEGGRPSPVPRADADRVLLLVPAQPQDEAQVTRWLALADQVSPPATPTYALLPTSDEADLARWRDVLRTRKLGARRGDALAPEQRAGRTLTELALRLAELSPTSDEDLALAAKHRPALFFDGDEPYPTPLNIDRLLEGGEIRLCDRGQALRSLCTEVHGSADLHNGADHLAFDGADLAPITKDSTIYVHVTRSGNDQPNSIYLDYWWYFPHNPAGAGGGALCGAGFVIAGVTCFDHQSDWEGVTVVLDADSPSGEPTAVSYAQHDGVSRYTWPAVQKLWDRGERADFGAGIDTHVRPLVFVARGTHASYPTACGEDRCQEGGVPGIPATRPLKEASHDGAKPWPRREIDCGSVCVTALPARNGGASPARWNAFTGRWGSAHCVFGFVCSSSQPPRSPSQQPRYRHPWCFAESYDFRAGRFDHTGQDCPGRIPSADELQRGERLLALGDSYSSGQGAGGYDEETTGHGNTCFRSDGAWPHVLADRLGLVALPSLACSGAVTSQVTDGNRARKEEERRVSQVSRIAGDPGVITITIGGNDAGFADVLSDCVTGDCAARYDRPSGDVLEERIGELGARLPSVYRAIQRAAPRARLVVVGYPRLFPARAPRRRPVGNCAAGKEIKADEVDYLNARTTSLNAAIAGAADVAGADFVDVTGAFSGRELRCEGETYLNRLRLNTDLFPASFHPNAAGHERLGEVVAARLAAE